MAPRGASQRLTCEFLPAPGGWDRASKGPASRDHGPDERPGGRLAAHVPVRMGRLDAATALRGLSRPGNRLEALKGRRTGQWSIRINARWRI